MLILARRAARKQKPPPSSEGGANQPHGSAKTTASTGAIALEEMVEKPTIPTVQPQLTQ
jgi:hypothetical protein